MFLDETWATANMTRTHGRAPRGARLVAAVPHGHWHTTTNVCGLRSTGPVAPLVLDCAINGAPRAYIEQMLAPTLASGDIVIMDNLGSHKVNGVREAIEARGGSPALPAALQPRPEPDRARLQQAQASASISCRKGR